MKRKMGWAGGSGLLENVWEQTRERVSKTKRVELLVKIIGYFEEYDCDTIGELQYMEDQWEEIKPALKKTGHYYDEDEDED